MYTLVAYDTCNKDTNLKQKRLLSMSRSSSTGTSVPERTFHLNFGVWVFAVVEYQLLKLYQTFYFDKLSISIKLISCCVCSTSFQSLLEIAENLENILCKLTIEYCLCIYSERWQTLTTKQQWRSGEWKGCNCTWRAKEAHGRLEQQDIRSTTAFFRKEERPKIKHTQLI